MMEIRILFILFASIYSSNIDAQKLECYNKISDTMLVSQMLPHSKSISIYLPVEWQKNINNKFPLTIIFDRQNRRIEASIINTIDYLTATSQIPTSVIISIDSRRNKRYLETSHKENNSEGLANETKKFLLEELIPFAEKELKASSFRLFIGHSRYAFFSTDLFINHIDKITAVIALDPFFVDGKINLLEDLKGLTDKEIKHHRYFRYSLGKNNYREIEPAEIVFKNLKNDKIHSEGLFFPQAYHNAIPGLAISNDLYEVYQFWAKQQNALVFDDSKFNNIKHFNSEVKKHYGETISPSLGVLNGIANAFFNKGNYTKSIEAWTILLDFYPNFSQVYLSIIEAQEKLNIDTRETIINFKKSLKKSTFYPMKQKAKMLKSIE